MEESSSANRTQTEATASATERLDALNAQPANIEWLETLELGYAADSSGVAGMGTATTTTNATTTDESDARCFYCRTVHTNLFRCARCNVAAYCQKDCQVNDWKTNVGGGRHKVACASYKRLGRQQQFSSAQDQATARFELFQRVRLYACAYACFKTRNLGRGFLFCQCQHSLAEMSLAIPKDCRGRPVVGARAVLLHYLTLGEFDAEVCRDDFEMALVRGSLQNAVHDAYDDRQQVVLLWRFRCGHVALGVAPLPLPYQACLKLGLDYFEQSDPPALQLNIDDV